MTEYDLGKVTGDKGDKGDKGDTGNTGNGISKIELYSTSGKQKTYRITYTNGNHFDFTVTDGDDGEGNIVTSWSTPLSDTNVPSEKLVKNSLPTKTSDLTNDGDGTNVFIKNNDSRLTDSRTPTSHTHGNLQNNGQVGSTAQANYNVVTDSNGKITTEAKPTIPQASSTTPSADTTNGSAGSGTTWAKADHTHPKSSIYAESSHTHTKSQITDFPSIPTKTSDLTNDGDGTNVFVKNNDSRLSDSRTPTSHTHGNLQNNGQVGSTAQANYNVVTDSNGKITTEAKPTIPSASSTTPSADVSGGAIGSGTTWAKADHQHPLSSAYATAGHTHTGMLTLSDIADNLTTNDSTKVLSAKQGYQLNQLIGSAISYINQ